MLKPKYKFEQFVEVRSTGLCGRIHEVFRSEKLPDEIVYKLYMDDWTVKFYNEQSLQEVGPKVAGTIDGPNIKIIFVKEYILC